MRLNEYLDDAGGDVLVCGCGCGYGSRVEHWRHGERVTVVDIHAAIRGQIGGPVMSLSGARCPRHNAQVSIANFSQHPICCALDLRCPPGWDMNKWRMLCENVVASITDGQGGVGFYPTQRFVHVDEGLDEAPGRRWTA